MSPLVSGDWQRLSPFAIVSFLGTAVKIFGRGAIQGIIPILAAVLLLRDDEPLNFARLLPILGGILLLVVVIAVIQWAYFKFRIAEDRLLIRNGFIRKTALDLPYERVQGINVERSLVDRIIGLVSVTLDTAGSVQAEGKLPSIRTEVADHLRASVAALSPGLEDNAPEGDAGEARDSGAEGLPTDAGADAVAGAGVGTSAPARARLATQPHWGRVLLKLGPADMVRIGVANRNFIFVAAMVGILTDLPAARRLSRPAFGGARSQCRQRRQRVLRAGSARPIGLRGGAHPRRSGCSAHPHGHSRVPAPPRLHPLA